VLCPSVSSTASQPGPTMADRPRVTVPKSVELALDSALDKALAIQRPAVLAYLDRVRAKRPAASPAEVIEQLERRYLAAVVGTGAASGGTAALPGVGTTTSIATGAAEIAAFVTATALFVLAVAEIHGVGVGDPQVRRALVLTVLLGEVAEPTVEAAAGGAAHWAHVLGRTNRDAIGGVNTRLAQLMVRRFGARQGALLVGRAIPLGIGAGIGAAGNAALARVSIGTARRAFGPAPKKFGARVIDAADSGDSGDSAASGVSGDSVSRWAKSAAERAYEASTRLRRAYARARESRNGS
jgi:hypothetical protein